MPARESARREVLRGVRGSRGASVRQLRSPAVGHRQVLLRVRPSRRSRRAGGITALRGAGSLHSQTPGREDPVVKGRARGRAQAGHRALRRPQGLDGAARRPRSRGGAHAPRPRARTHDGGRPPLRGHGEPGDGRRDHGALRRAARPRGSRGARVLRRAPDAGVAETLRGRHAPLARGGGADPGRSQLGRGRRPLGRQRSPHGLHRRGPDDPPRGPDGTAGAARDGAADRRDRAARRGLRRGAVARAHPREGSPGPDRALRADGGGDGAHATAGRGAPRPHALRRPRRRGRAPAPSPRPGRRRPRPGGRHRRRGRGGQVTAHLRVHPLASGAGLADPGGRLRLLRQGHQLPARDRPAQGLLQDR